MAAVYEQPNDVIKRVRFFDGQYLQDQDFVDEQHYQIDRQRRHNRTLHVAGIAEGLDVTIEVGAAQVVVAAGTAIDADGRPLVLVEEPAEARTVNLQNFLDSIVNLYLVFQEVESDLQASGGTDYGRWLEQPQLVVVDEKATHEFATPPVLLARIILNSQAAETVDASVRVYSGLRLPGPAADAPTLRTAASGLVGLAGSLTVDGNVGIGTTNPDHRLEVNGAIEIQVDDADSKLRFNYPGHVVYSMGIDQSDGGKFKLNYGGNIGETTHFVLTHEGNVGLGTNDPGDYRLSVNGSTNLGGTLTVDGNVGIGTTSQGAKLEVAGDIKFTGDNLITGILGRITPLYVRGTGLNNNGARVLILGSTAVYNVASGRGLTLTILNKTDHSVISTTTYDTHGRAAKSNELATVLNGITKEQIGLLTSFDAWEGAISDNLRTALRRVGLYKAAVTAGGVRRPYAALFEASSSATVGTAKAVEVLYSNNASAPFAEIRGWLMDGSFVATAGAPNALTNNLGADPVVIVNEANNVGIGTTDPDDFKLNVSGNTNLGGTLTVTGKTILNGDVGIGIQDPGSYKLNVKGGNARLGESLHFDADQEILFQDNGQIRSLDNYHRILFRRNENKMELREFGDLIFSPGATQGVETAKVVMWANGNVGIGTTSPGDYKLNVSGNTNLGGTLAVTGATTLKSGLEVNGAIEIKVDNADSLLRFHDPGNVWYSMGIDQSDGGKFKLNGGGNIGENAHFVMTSDGNVGIGTDTPGAKLEVDGTVVAKNFKIGNTAISESELIILKKLASSELTVAIACAHNGYLIDNYSGRRNNGDNDRTIQFRSNTDKDIRTIMKLLIT